MIINIAVKGISIYEMVNVVDIIDMNDTYDLVTETGDIFINKDFGVIDHEHHMLKLNDSVMLELEDDELLLIA